MEIWFGLPCARVFANPCVAARQTCATGTFCGSRDQFASPGRARAKLAVPGQFALPRFRGMDRLAHAAWVGSQGPQPTMRLLCKRVCLFVGCLEACSRR